MTTTEKQILALLEKQQNIDKMIDGTFTENFRFLLHAVKLLLRNQIELRKELRDAGILR